MPLLYTWKEQHKKHGYGRDMGIVIHQARVHRGASDQHFRPRNSSVIYRQFNVTFTCSKIFPSSHQGSLGMFDL